MDKTGITVELVERLIADQFPQWADRLVQPVEHDGWETRRSASVMTSSCACQAPTATSLRLRRSTSFGWRIDADSESHLPERNLVAPLGAGL